MGNILNIQRFCTDDGPGIRTTVFLKGCPLHCLWCHNPESQVCRSELLYDAKACIGCGRCEHVCEKGCHSVGQTHSFTRSKCVGCGTCAKTCPTEALVLYGNERSVQDVWEEVKRDAPFYQSSGGGVTLSGGEPLLQPAFSAELLRKCREEKIHTAIETCGFAEEEALCSVLTHCDLVLFDIKETDEERHKRYTGVSFAPILQNLRRINEMGIPFLIRAPIIPTLNDRKAHLQALKVLAESMSSCQGVQIMPYHRIGTYKYERMGRAYACGDIQEPSQDTVAAWRALV